MRSQFQLSHLQIQRNSVASNQQQEFQVHMLRLQLQRFQLSQVKLMVLFMQHLQEQALMQILHSHIQMRLFPHLIHMHLLLLCLVMRLARNLKVLLIHRLIRKHLLLSSKQKTALYSRLLQMAMLKMLSHHQQQEQSLRLHLICLLAREYKDFQRSTITCLSDKFLNILRFSKGRFII